LTIVHYRSKIDIPDFVVGSGNILSYFDDIDDVVQKTLDILHYSQRMIQ